MAFFLFLYLYLKAALSFLNLEYLSKLKGKRGFRKITQRGRKGCLVNHALWWVINRVYNYILLLINCA